MENVICVHLHKYMKQYRFMFLMVEFCCLHIGFDCLLVQHATLIYYEIKYIINWIGYMYIEFLVFVFNEIKFN